MGGTLSTVWNSFSAPYKVAIAASFLMWLGMQRNRVPGLLLHTIFAIFAVALRRLTGRSLNKNWTYKEELMQSIVRKFLASDIDVLRSLLTTLSIHSPKKNPVQYLRAKTFNATWYGKEGPDDKILVYIHGGGYVSGHSLMYATAFDFLLKNLEEKGISCRIFSIEYSLAPKNPFPAAISECVAAYEYLIKNLSIGPNRIILAGDSAGGALCVSLCYQIRQHFPPPIGLVLISPWVSSQSEYTNPTAINNLQTDILQPSFLRKATEYYLQGRPQNHLTSPILGNTEQLPRMLVFVGGLEIFKEDIHEFVRKAQKENPEREMLLLENSDMVHDYVVLTDQFEKHSHQGLTQMADFMISAYNHFV